MGLCRPRSSPGAVAAWIEPDAERKTAPCSLEMKMILRKLAVPLALEGARVEPTWMMASREGLSINRMR